MKGDLDEQTTRVRIKDSIECVKDRLLRSRKNRVSIEKEQQQTHGKATINNYDIDMYRTVPSWLIHGNFNY